ncbi:MAG: SgcJ/EcaC family oxidoreductase [Pirellulales bacterium]|nr:SgcJ/EcaC family oxidoreductase [Pirellulales bacterium]
MTKLNEDIEAIKQLAETWRSGWLAGDADLLLSLYADQPVLMPQDQPAVVGKGAIRPLYEAVLKEFDFKSEGTVKEVVVSGDVGYFWSAYTLTATPKAGGEPMKVVGKSLFIVRREPGGAWKITRLMDNSDGVTPGQNQR